MRSGNISLETLQKIDALGVDWSIEGKNGVKAADEWRRGYIPEAPQLCEAAYNGCADLAAFLISKGANVQCKGDEGKTPFELTQPGERGDACRALLTATAERQVRFRQHVSESQSVAGQVRAGF